MNCSIRVLIFEAGILELKITKLPSTNPFVANCFSKYFTKRSNGRERELAICAKLLIMVLLP